MLSERREYFYQGSKKTGGKLLLSYSPDSGECLNALLYSETQFKTVALWTFGLYSWVESKLDL